jgi:threonine/homoserine/homoserine lactone efflux protein
MQSLSGYFLWGGLIGLAVAAPIGPVNIICLQRTLKSGVVVGLLSGLGAAIGDSLFGFVAAFGVTVVSDFLMAHLRPFQTAGGLLLLFIAVRTWREHPHLEVKGSAATQILKSFISVFFLTITNPVTILGFVAFFASVGLGRVGRDMHQASLLVAGIFAGSALWWVILTNSVRFLKGRLNDNHLLVINRASALLMAGFGLLALGRNWFV